MTEKIEVTIDKIHLALQTRHVNSLAIIDGEAGCCLFNKLYNEYKGRKTDESFQPDIQQLAENSIGFSLPSYCQGKPGINWFFAYLKKQGIIDDEDFEMICEDDKIFSYQSVFMVNQGKYDFLHGGLGIAYQLLYSRGKEYEHFFEDIFKALKEQSYNDNNELFLVDYNFERNTGRTNRANLGLAHGMPSVLKFCLQCYNQGICTADSKAMATDIITFIRKNQNSIATISIFPNNVFPGKPNNDISRLAWCYGDLSIGYILYQAGLAFGDTELHDFALETMIATTKRKTYETTRINDAGFCHGTAGVAHLYNRMWRYSQLPVFKQACDFWIEETLSFSRYEDGLAGFKTLNGFDQTLINSYSLLDGVTGTGLTLLSYITGDCSWDYCLMLND